MKQRRFNPLDQETFAKVQLWGEVNPGTTLVDTSDNRYVVGHQNEAGFLALRYLTEGRIDPSDKTARGKDKAFEVMDHIDHSKFRVR
jgi:hypothetical protein